MLEMIDRLLNGYEKGNVSRRDLIMALAALGVGGKAAAQAPSRAQLQPRGINHVSIFVADRQRSVDFYQRVFDMPVKSIQQNGTNLTAGEGNQFLGIYEVPSASPRIDHVCFAVDDFDVDGTMQTLADNDVEARLRMREDETAEIYFTDPDGISIQVQDRRYCGGGGLLGDQCV